MIDSQTNAFDHLSTIDVDNFEVIATTGPTEGPRSPGFPIVDAGANQVVDLGTTVMLHGVINAPAGTVTVEWKLYAGPNEVTFGSPNSADTSVSFTQPGSYVFELGADDSIHAVAYDAVVISVMPQTRWANLSTRAAVSATKMFRSAALSCKRRSKRDFDPGHRSFIDRSRRARRARRSNPRAARRGRKPPAEQQPLERNARAGNQRDRARARQRS